MRKFRKRVATLRTVGIAMAIITLSLIIPALFAIPDAGGALVLAAAMPFGMMLRSPDSYDGGGGATFEDKLLKGVEHLTGKITDVRKDVDSLKQTANAQAATITSLRKQGLTGIGRGMRPAGMVSDDCARALFADVLLHVARSGKLEELVRDAGARSRLFEEAKSLAGVSRALGTNEIPLPETYGSELLELIAEFGVARKAMTLYPIGGGTAKPPRMGTRPAFTAIAMSDPFPEKKPTLTFASLEAHKLGGIVVCPGEIEAASAVQIGRYLAQYGAVEFARAEDTWAFLADGTATYDTVKGICTIATENNKVVTLAGGKTLPSDATGTDFRSMRRLVSTAALSRGRYYLHQSWETALRHYNTEADPYFFVYTPDGTARLDGFPITWTEVLEPYGTAAAPGKNLAVFGALNYWWFGQRRQPRMDTSEHAYFAYDQIAVRFLEELDFDYASLEAASCLQTAAA